MPSGSETTHITRLWQEVFQPAVGLSVPTLPLRISNDPAFDPDTALIFAWLCHVVYESDPGRRGHLLQEAGFEETRAYHKNHLHWSLIRSSAQPDCHIVSFRGTSDLRHWLFNVKTLLSSWPNGGKAHSGFASAYRLIAEPLKEALGNLSAEQLWFTGHSLGGVLALFAASEFSGRAAYTFGCPRPGNPSFASILSDRLPIHRVVHNQDLVTTIPYALPFLEDLAYQHVGVPVHLRPDEPIAINDKTHLPRSRKSWKQALHAMLEGDHIGEPLPALQDHAPAAYVRTLQGAKRFES